MSTKFSKLITKEIKSSNWISRRRAIIQLSHYQNPDLYGIYSDALSDPVSEVRHAAILALARLGDKRAVAHLGKPKFLQSADTNIRWATVHALGELGDIYVIDMLMPLVDDEDWLVRNEAITELYAKVEDIVKRAEPALARILIRMLTLNVPGISEMAVKGLVDLAIPCHHLLLDALKSINIPVRQNVALVLGLAKAKGAVPFLIEALQDASPLVRAEAAKALGNIGDEHAIIPLLRAIKGHNDYVRKVTVESLVKFGQIAVDPLHIELYHEKTKFSICAIIETLGKIQAPSSIPILINHLSSSFYSVRKVAVNALTQYGQQIVNPLLQKLSDNTSNIKALLSIAAKKNGVSNRIKAIKALGDMEDYRATPILKKLITSSETQIAVAAEDALVKIGCSAWGRCGAIMVIGNVGEKSAINLLIKLLKDASPHVRYEAVRAIGKLKTKKAVQVLEEMAKSDPTQEVRTETLKVLWELIPGSSELFKLAMISIDDSSKDIRLQSTRILGDFSDDRSIQSLLQKFNDPSWSVRVSAENAICNFGEKIVPLLIKHLGEKRQEGRCRIISAIARLGSIKAISALEQILSEESEDAQIIAITRKALTILKGETAKNAANLSIPIC